MNAKKTKSPLPYWQRQKRRLERYHTALGSFVAMFAEVELMLNFAVWHYSNVNKPMATAIFGPIRVEECSNKLRNIVTAHDLKGDRIKELMILLNQIQIIQKIRNDILHFGFDRRTFIVTTETLAYRGKPIRQHITSTRILRNMTVDLSIIHYFLDLHLHAELIGESYELFLEPSWSYTPPPQSQNVVSTQARRQARRRQPRSSQA